MPDEIVAELTQNDIDMYQQYLNEIPGKYCVPLMSWMAGMVARTTASHKQKAEPQPRSPEGGEESEKVRRSRK